MDKLVLCLFIVSVFACAWCKAGQDSIDSGLVVSKVDRKIDAATHLVKVSASLTVENNGNSAVKSFLYVIDDGIKDHISFFGATVIHLFTLHNLVVRISDGPIINRHVGTSTLPLV